MQYSLLALGFVWLLAGCRQNTSPVTAVQLYPHTVVVDSTEGFGFEVRDSAFANLVDTQRGIEVLGGGFEWSEGPVWVGGADPKLLFNDVPGNVTYVWRPGNVADSYAGNPTAGGVRGVDTFFYPSGYFADPAIEGEPGANGMVVDKEGQLLLAMHGERAIGKFKHNLQDPEHSWQQASKLEHFELLTTRYGGKRFHSPNDLVQLSNGDLLFTDPTYGVDKTFGEAARELAFPGVYRMAAGTSEPELLIGSMTRPNGIVVTPDESAVIVANSDPELTVWWKCNFAERPPSLENPWCEVFADMTSAVGSANPGNADGMVMHPSGVLFATGPGGVLCFSDSGTHLGTIRTGRATANVTLGGHAGNELFITADDLLLRVRLSVSER